MWHNSGGTLVEMESSGMWSAKIMFVPYQSMDVVVMLFTSPICDEFLQIVGKAVQGTNISMFYFNFPLWNRGINVFFHCQTKKIHIFIRENQVLLHGPEGKESLKKFLVKVLNAVPALVRIVGPLAGHLLLQMLHMTLMNGLCYPCLMHAPLSKWPFPLSMVNLPSPNPSITAYMMMDTGDHLDMSLLSFFLSFFFVDGVLMCSCVHHQALHNWGP